MSYLYEQMIVVIPEKLVGRLSNFGDSQGVHV